MGSNPIGIILKTRLDIYIMWKFDDVVIFTDYLGHGVIAKLLSSSHRGYWNIEFLVPHTAFGRKSVITHDRMKGKVKVVTGKEREFYEMFWRRAQM